MTAPSWPRTAPSDLRGVRFLLGPGPAVDPFALVGTEGVLFHDDGRVLVGLGEATILTLPHGLDDPAELAAAHRRLTSIPCDDRTGLGTCGVIGFGSLPFDRWRSASLVVPAVTYGRERSGEEWVTVISSDPEDLATGPGDLRSRLVGATTAPLVPGPTVAGGGRSSPHVLPRSTDEAFVTMVTEAVSAVDTGWVDKVVLARQVDVVMDEPIVVGDLLRRWHQLEPSCAVFSLPTADGLFVGASPELLVDRSGRTVHSRPLAGTTDRSDGVGGVLPRELLASRKDGAEHRLVVEAIEAALAPWCEALTSPDRPDLVHLHTITHLGTSVHGTLRVRPDGTVPSALELLALLHPTPAVGGVPTGRAIELIGRLEPEPRGPYAGAVGTLDARGDGRWMLGIRALTVSDRTARLAAGVGIVSGSRPATELAETTLKLSAAFDALAPGEPFTTSGIPPQAEAVS